MPPKRFTVFDSQREAGQSAVGFVLRQLRRIWPELSPLLGRSLITLSKVSRQVPRARTAATPPDLVRLLYRRHSYPHLKRLLQRCAAAAGAEY